jgi:Fe-Mn family superoxide dismutase
MHRRDFLFSSSTLMAAAAMASGCTAKVKYGVVPKSPLIAAAVDGAYTVPPLSYAYDALEPVIDMATMKLHHDVHHAAYVKNLNAALAQHPMLLGYSLEALLADLALVPEAVRDTIRNHGGGHFNHALFWESMRGEVRGAGVRMPEGDLASAINTSFGDFKTFQEKFQDAGMKRFGSGWVWLVKDAGRALSIMTTPNQDTPLATGFIPLLGNDVWEHAYYLKYQSKRADYLAAWWRVVDWGVVSKRFAA